MLAHATAVGTNQTSSADSQARWVNAVSVLFFFSGFPALIYQLVWQRALFRLFGVNVESVTIVVTAFMVGLGLGSLAGGWLSRQTRLPLLPLLAAIELMTALFGVCSLSIFDAVDSIALGLPLSATAALALALVLVPTVLMGATLPVLVGELSRRFGSTGQSMGLLYCVNTLGAGAACLAGMMVLFPFLGMAGSIAVAAAINAAVAISALLVHRYGLAPTDAQAERATAQTGAAAAAPSLPFAHMLGLAALAGLVSLSYEIFFFRLQSLATGGNASAFAVTLGAFLIGIASGSQRAGILVSEFGPRHAAREVLKALLAACVMGFFYLPIINLVAPIAGANLGVSLLMVIVIARAWGMVLPYLAHLGIAADGGAGERVSYLYLANIAGSATGSILTGFVLMHYLPLVMIAQLLTAASLICAALMARAIGATAVTSRTMTAIAAVAVIAISLLPRLSANLFERLQFGADAEAATPFVRVIENRSGIIAVDTHGTVWGHGMYDGKFNTSLSQDVNGVFRPYALSLFHPHPRHVLMIGLASGSWARIVASNPEVETLTVIEINPGYVDLIRERPEVASVLTDPKITVVIDDGRRWLRMHPQAKFDAVVSNTTWHFRANVTNLLSREFIGLVSDHLAEGGIFYYNTTHSSRAQLTACQSMPDALRFSNHMVVSKSPIAVDFDRWRGVLESYEIGHARVLDLKVAGDKAVVDHLLAFRNEATPAGGTRAKMLETCPEIMSRTAGLAPFTDDNMGSEWRRMLGLDIE